MCTAVTLRLEPPRKEGEPSWLRFTADSVGFTPLRGIALCLAAALAVPSAAAAQDQRAVLELVVNGVTKGETLVVLRGRDALVGATRLRDAGLHGFGGTRETIDGEELVSLGSLADVLVFRLDERELRLVLVVSPSLLATSVRSYHSAAPPDITYRSDTSAFVNYAVNWAEGSGASLFTESAAHAGRALIYNTASVNDGSVIRGLTSVTFDDRRTLRRWVAGDGFARTGPLGGDAWIGGITVAREFAIEPYFVTHPSLSLAAPVAIPSTVEVHVNGRLVSQEQVAPGRLDLRNLPLTMGRNDARIVVRDAFGNASEISTSYYQSNAVLSRGLHDYQYSLGFRRDALGLSSWGYKKLVSLARHRYGVSDALTLGGRAEAASGLFSLGPSASLRLPFGDVEGTGGFSAGDEGRGAAGLAAYTYSGRPFGAGASILAATAAYATVNAPPRDDRPALEVSAFGGTSIGARTSVTIQHNRARLHGGTSRARSALLGSLRLTRRLVLTASVAYVRDATGKGPEALVGLSALFGRTTTTVSAAGDRAGSSVGVETQQPLPVGVGYGYYARAETGTPGSVAAAAQYQGRFGRYELRRDVFGGQAMTSASVAGSVVAIGGDLYASRPVQQSFALMRVPGVGGVRGFASNQEVGRTNKAGNLLVPDLQPYYGNLLNISDTDIPLDYSIGGVRTTIAPPYRGGALVVFPVQPLRRITGSIRIGLAPAGRVPRDGELSVTLAGEDAPVTSPVGADGAFYFENLPAGRHRAVVRDSMGECALVLEVPASTDAATDLGTVPCLLPVRR
jgi:outer membrane usher protein